MGRLVSIITSIEALLQGVVRSVDTLVALHQLDVDGLSNMSTRVNEITVRHTPFLTLQYCVHVLTTRYDFVSTILVNPSYVYTFFHLVLRTCRDRILCAMLMNYALLWFHNSLALHSSEQYHQC